MYFSIHTVKSSHDFNDIMFMYKFIVSNMCPSSERILY